MMQYVPFVTGPREPKALGNRDGINNNAARPVFCAGNFYPTIQAAKRATGKPPQKFEDFRFVTKAEFAANG